MQRPLIPSFIFILLAPLSAFQSANPPASLQITVLNVQPSKGKVVVELYNDASDWLKTPYRKTTLPPDESTKTTSFAVPAGKYAVSVYQDINGNGELDRNFLGIPKEPVGFGNNYRPFGKPNFESAVIEQKANTKPEAIKLFSAF